MELIMIFAFVPKTEDCAKNYAKFCKTFKKEYNDEGRAIFCENLAFYFNTTVKECIHCEITSVFDRPMASLVGKPIAMKDSRSLDLCQMTYCAASDPMSYLAELPVAVDHRTLGLTTLSQDYQNCGSCWSFSEAAVIENAILLDYGKITSATFNKNAKDLDISENFLLRNTYGMQTYCDGGNAQTALHYAFQNGWKTFEIQKNYPYDNGRSQKYWKENKLAEVKIPEKDWYFPIKSFDGGTVTVRLPIRDNIESVMQYLARGIAVLATMSTQLTATSQRILSSYSGRWPLQHLECTNNIDHYVLFIGYGKFKGEDVWLVKNSWGKDFGSKGSFYIPRGKNSWCIEQYAYAAVPLHYDEADGVFSKQFVSAYTGIKRGMLGFDKDDGSFTNLDKHYRNLVLYILAGCVAAAIIVGVSICLGCKYCKKHPRRYPAETSVYVASTSATTVISGYNQRSAYQFKGKKRRL